MAPATIVAGLGYVSLRQWETAADQLFREQARDVAAMATEKVEMMLRHAEDAFLDAGKRSPGEEEGGAGSIFDRKRTQIAGCQTHLFSFLGGRGHGLADLSKATHRWAAR